VICDYNTIVYKDTSMQIKEAYYTKENKTTMNSIASPNFTSIKFVNKNRHLKQQTAITSM